jgi:hypothetical protein
MADEASPPAEPAWVERMRAAGYVVRTGTGTGGLSFEPEVDFSPPHQQRRGFRSRLSGAARKLWKLTGSFKRRIIHPERHASLP